MERLRIRRLQSEIDGYNAYEIGQLIINRSLRAWLFGPNGLDNEAMKDDGVLIV